MPITEKTWHAPLEVGEILYASWGYDQTNIDWYVVLKRTAKTVTLVQLPEARSAEIEFMQYDSMPAQGPLPDDYGRQGKPFRRTIKRDELGGESEEYVNVNGYKAGVRWDGKPRRGSSYA